MKFKTILFLLAALALTGATVVPERRNSYEMTDDTIKRGITMKQRSARNWIVQITQNDEAIDLSGPTPQVYFQYAPLANGWLQTITGSVFSVTNGQVLVPFRPTTTDTNGTFDFDLVISQGSTGVNVEVWGEIRLLSRAGGGATNVFPSTGTNVDLSTYTFINVPWQEILPWLSFGDIVYFDGTNAQRLAIGNENDTLVVSSGAPAWLADGVGITITNLYDVNAGSNAAVQVGREIYHFSNTNAQPRDNSLPRLGNIDFDGHSATGVGGITMVGPIHMPPGGDEIDTIQILRFMPGGGAVEPANNSSSLEIGQDPWQDITFYTFNGVAIFGNGGLGGKFFVGGTGVIERIVTAETNLGDVSNRMVTAETDITNLETNLDDVSNRVDIVTNDTANLENNLNNVSGRVVTAEIDIGDLETNLGNVSSRVDIAETDITNLEGNLNNVSGRVDTVETDITNLENNLNNVSGRVDVAETDITNLEGETNKYYLASNPSNYTAPESLDEVLTTGNDANGQNATNFGIIQSDTSRTDNVDLRGVVITNTHAAALAGLSTNTSDLNNDSGWVASNNIPNHETDPVYVANQSAGQLYSEMTDAYALTNDYTVITNWSVYTNYGNVTLAALAGEMTLTAAATWDIYSKLSFGGSANEDYEFAIHADGVEQDQLEAQRATSNNDIGDMSVGGLIVTTTTNTVLTVRVKSLDAAAAFTMSKGSLKAVRIK